MHGTVQSTLYIVNIHWHILYVVHVQFTCTWLITCTSDLTESSIYTFCMFQDDRQDRIQASLKEREREVALSRTAQAREWDKERDQLRKTEALENFKALLVDLVRFDFLYMCIVVHVQHV